MSRPHAVAPAFGVSPVLSRTARNAPIIFFAFYLSLTVGLFALGPWPWPVPNPAKLYGFLGAAHLALVLGFATAPSRSQRVYTGRLTPNTLVRAAAISTIALFFPTMLFRTGSIIPNIAASVADLGAAYVRSGELRRGGSTPLIEYVRFVFGPLLHLLLPLTVFFWDALQRHVRVLALMALCSTIAMYIAMGTNKALADTVLLVPCILVAAHFSGRRRLRFTRATLWALIGSASFATFLAFFTATQTTRPGSGSYVGYNRAADVSVDYNNFMVKDLTPAAVVGVVGLTSYVGQGYYATSLALEEPWVPTWGVGNSFFTLRQAQRVAGDEISDDPYPMRIEARGWDAYGLFSSIYPWIASDVSFPGTIIVVFVIGRLLALAWKDAVLSHNPFAVAFLAHLCIMLFYFPANNQMLQSGEGFSAFWVTLVVWRGSRGRFHPAHSTPVLAGSRP